MPIDKFGRFVGKDDKKRASTESFTLPEYVVTKQYVTNELEKFKKEQEALFTKVSQFYTERIDPLLIEVNAAEQALAPLIEGYKKGNLIWHEDVQKKLGEAHLTYERTLQQTTINLINEAETRLGEELLHQLTFYTNQIDSGLRNINTGLQELAPLVEGYKQGKLFPYEDVQLKLKEAALKYENKLAETSNSIIESAKLQVETRLKDIDRIIVEKAKQVQRECESSLTVIGSALIRDANSRIGAIERRIGITQDDH